MPSRRCHEGGVPVGRIERLRNLFPEVAFTDDVVLSTRRRVAQRTQTTYCIFISPDEAMALGGVGAEVDILVRRVK